MATGQESGIVSENAQWSSDMVMSDGSPLTGIPKAWLNAEQALQKVQQMKKDPAPAATATDTVPVSNTCNYPYYWPQMYGYQSYQFPGYSSFYNMAMPNSNPYSSYYQYAQMPTPQQVPSVPNQMVQPSPTATATTQSSGVALSQLASQPPPPPPTPPPASENMRNSFGSAGNKQAPGTSNIRFSLPNRKTPKMNSLLAFNKKEGRGRKQNANYQDNHNGIISQKFIPLERVRSDVEPEEKKTGDVLEQLGFNIDETNCWPDPLKEYLGKCFIKCSSQLQKDRMAIVLKGKLGQALKDESFWDKDWNKEPVVSLCNDPSRRDQDLLSHSSPNKMPYTIPKISEARHRTPTYKRTRSRSFSRSRSRSRSRSLSPYPRRVVQRRDHSSGSSSSSSSSSQLPSRKQSVCSSVVSQGSFRGKKFGQNARNSSAKKKNKKKKIIPYIPVDPMEVAENEARLQRRAVRFKSAGGKKAGSQITMNATDPMNPDNDDEVNIDWSSYAIIGTCTDIEKPYLRITSAVDSTTIRPLGVLQKSLVMVKEHWKKNHDYRFACEQLKSIRQDLVVQCIRNSFTISVYEMHARIALEKSDHTEFNQCQSQLKVLFEELHEGNKEEFVAYRILYNMFTQDTREIKNIISTLSLEERRNSVISYAMALNVAWTLNNFHVFFKLYIAAPKMAGFIIDLFIGKIRKAAMRAYTKSYRPTLPVEFVEKELGFTSLEDLMPFLDELGIVLSDDKSSVLCKESLPALTA